MDEDVDLAPGVKARGLSFEELKAIWERASVEPYRIPEDRRAEIIEEATEERHSVSMPFAKSLFHGPVSRHSMAVTQACRLLQYYLFSDDKGILPAAGKGLLDVNSTAWSRYAAIESFVQQTKDSDPTDSEASAAYEEVLRQHFPGLELGQLGFLCHMAWLFCGSADMRRFLLDRRLTVPGDEEGTTIEMPVIFSDEIGEYLRMRHGRGYLATESFADDPEGYYENKNLTQMEAHHESVLSSIGEFVEDLWKTKSIHPLAFLARLLDLQGYVGKVLPSLRGSTLELGDYVLTGKQTNMTEAMDAKLRLASLRLRFPDCWTLHDLANLVKPSTKNPVRLGDEYWADVRNLAWYADFEVADVKHAAGLAEIVSIPSGFAACLFGLEEIEMMLDPGRNIR